MSQLTRLLQRRPYMAAVIAGGLVMGVALGSRHVQGLFLLPITTDRSWSRESFGFAIALQNLVWGLAQPLTGMLADRFGSARVIGVGCLVYAIGLFGMSEAGTLLLFTSSAGVLVGVALACTSFGLIYGAVSRIVPEPDRPWALGVTGALGGLGQFFMVPAAQGLIQNVGWGWALVAFAVLVAACAPSASALRDRGESRPIGTPQPQLSLRDAIREAFSHRGFLLLNAGFVACGFQLAFIATHMPAYLLDRGISAAVAVDALALVALANVVGTYWCGVLGGRYRRKNLLAALYVTRSAAIALFIALPPTDWSVYLFSAAMGLLWLGTVPLTNGIVSQVFGLKYISTLFGFVFLGHQLGAFLGAWLGGAAFDLTGSYTPAWIASIGIGLAAAALHLLINDEPILRPSPAAA